ncbi:hypothetical protein [Natrialba aegyptia]|nr:hypothetical protein [Natrialba aegyptia]
MAIPGVEREPFGYLDTADAAKTVSDGLLYRVPDDSQDRSQGRGN